MEQLLEFIANHPYLTGAFGLVLAALIATEAMRLVRRWKEVDTHEAIRLINREDALVIDVSNSADHARGHILGAMHMPPSRIEAGDRNLFKHKDRPVLVYCKNGQISPQMAGKLVRMGFSRISVLKGGLNQWISDQQPVSSGKAVSAKPGKAGKRKGKAGKEAPGTTTRERAISEPGD